MPSILPAAALLTLAIPPGAYLGIWADPTLAANQERSIELREGPAPSGIGRTFALHLHYYDWGALAMLLDANGHFQPDSELAGDISHGRIPVISWGCDLNTPDSDNVVAGGNAAEDTIISATARALAQYPGPVLLRWFWEFNVLSTRQSCRGDTAATPQRPTQQQYDDFTGSWRHIWQLFQNAGATNVAFLWNPGDYTSDTAQNDPHGFYPGNQYVDWIGIDTYQRSAAATFASDLEPFYNDFSQAEYGKPILVGENGSPNYSVNNREEQATYLAGVLADFQNKIHPLIKGYDYFDSGTAGSWVLDDNNGAGNGGLAAMSLLGASQTMAFSTPQFPAQGVVNAASFLPSIAPGSIASIFGTGFTSLTLSASSLPLPVNLAGASVTFNGVAAPIFYASPLQLNVQVPFQITPGSATMIVRSGAAASTPVNVNIESTGAGLFAVVKDGGNAISAYLTGQGSAVTHPVATGAAAESSPLSVPTVPITASIGGQTAMLLGSGLAPGFVGLLQVNLMVPNLAPGTYPVTVTIGGTTSNAVMVTLP